MERAAAEQHRDWLLYGSGDRHITFEWKQRGGSVWKHGGKWEGIVPSCSRSSRRPRPGPRRMQLEKYMRVRPLPDVPRAAAQPAGPRRPRRRQDARRGRRHADRRPGRLARPERRRWRRASTPLQQTIADELLKEIRGRLGFLLNVGLHYLTLDRSAPTLSGGEAQRIRLAGQIGCGLVGVLYILDEPSIGLHPRDNDRLLASLERLRDMGNTVIVVEHDEDTMRAADYLVDFGPGPGVRGGEVVAAGTLADVVAEARAASPASTSPAQGRSRSRSSAGRRPTASSTIVGARQNNLKNIDVEIPLGLFVCVTGVSGSGKSSLVNDILLEGLRGRGRRTARRGRRARTSDDEPHEVGAHDRIDGVEHLDKVIDIDQSPIGRTPRSNPATYIKLFDEIRDLYAELPEAKVRGYKPGRFSFNEPGGRCEACEGNGSNRLEMDFLADVWVTCPVCEGQRFNRETLQVRFKGKSIHDVLEMDVQEALEHFANVPKIRGDAPDAARRRPRLPQARPALADALRRRGPAHQAGPRAGAAAAPARRSTSSTSRRPACTSTTSASCCEVLHGFVDAGNTVVVIEHNLDVIKTADWVIDLGPEGGAGGGEVVAAGTPEAGRRRAPSRYTGQALAPVLDPSDQAGGTNGEPDEGASAQVVADGSRSRI